MLTGILNIHPSHDPCIRIRLVSGYLAAFSVEEHATFDFLSISTTSRFRAVFCRLTCCMPLLIVLSRKFQFVSFLMLCFPSNPALFSFLRLLHDSRHHVRAAFQASSLHARTVASSSGICASGVSAGCRGPLRPTMRGGREDVPEPVHRPEVGGESCRSGSPGNALMRPPSSSLHGRGRYRGILPAGAMFQDRSVLRRERDRLIRPAFRFS